MKVTTIIKQDADGEIASAILSIEYPEAAILKHLQTLEPEEIITISVSDMEEDEITELSAHYFEEYNNE
jgi:hypothetical protein